MLRYAARHSAALAITGRRYGSSFHPHPISTLPSAEADVFKSYFDDAVPILFPRGTFQSLPAVSKWFNNSQLNYEYLEGFGETAVPIELRLDSSFSRTDASLSAFLAMCRARAQASRDLPQAYIAQCPISDLPQAMQDDVPTPELLKLVGRGDIYQSSVWLGNAPTFTPLHKDPNPNLFVQLCGRKVVRLMEPGQGALLFGDVRRRLGQSAAGSALRGEEMMEGPERDLLEKLVWDAPEGEMAIVETQMEVGDGLFIPKGWWHSIKGVGESMTASVNWWFR